MSDPFKGQPSNSKPAQPKSSPVKLSTNAPPNKGAHQIKVPDGGLSSKLGRK